MANQQQGAADSLVLSIGGMTCTGCERRLEAAARRLAGVRAAKAAFGAGTLILTYDPGLVPRDALIHTVTGTVEALGYTVGTKAGAQADGSFGVKQLLGIAVILAAVFLVLQRTGVLNRVPEVDPSMGYGVLFLVGLLTSLHCVGMCGGINLSQAVRKSPAAAAKAPERLRPAILYNAGRVLSYTVIGGVVGAIGSLVGLSGTARGWLVFVVGLFMLLMGLNMLDVFPWLRRITPRLPGGLGRRLSAASGSRGPFVVGLLNGFMPCGPLQSVQLYALATGSFLAGALSMFLFSLGTVPLMFGLGALGSLLTRRFTRRMIQLSALVVMLLGVAMVNRGLNLTGTRIAALGSGIFSGLPRSTAEPGAAKVAQVQDGVQVVRTRLGASRYEPIIVQNGIPVRWTIQAESSDLNGCNNPITIPEYGIALRMSPGENLIEFVPRKEGNVLYTCWMGMISSTIRVVGDLAKVTGEDLEEANRFAEASSAPGGSCCPPGGEAPSGPLELDVDYRIPADRLATARIADGVQHVSVEVMQGGFSPAVLVVQRGVPAQWTLEGVELTEENSRVVIPAYQARFELAEGANTLGFVPTFDFTFDSWTNTMHGYVKVVEDLDTIDLQEIRAQVAAFASAIREQARARIAEAQGAGSGRGGADSP